jgi:hypothetical protein
MLKESLSNFKLPLSKIGRRGSTQPSMNEQISPKDKDKDKDNKDNKDNKEKEKDKEGGGSLIHPSSGESGKPPPSREPSARSPRGKPDTTKGLSGLLSPGKGSKTEGNEDYIKN